MRGHLAFTLPSLRGSMRTRGASSIVLMATRQPPLGAIAGVSRWIAMAYAHKTGVAERLNEWLSSYAARYPSAVALATVHPHDPMALES